MAAIFIAASTAFATPIQDWIAAHPGWFANTISGIMIFFRIVTTKAIWDKGQPKKCEHPECPGITPHD